MSRTYVDNLSEAAIQTNASVEVDSLQRRTARLTNTDPTTSQRVPFNQNPINGLGQSLPYYYRVSQDPTKEGEVIFWIHYNGKLRRATMHVAIYWDGELVWAPVRIAQISIVSDL